MKAAKIALVVVFISALIVWVRGGQPSVHPAKLLPFLGGHRVSIYDFGAVAMILMTVVALTRRPLTEEELARREATDETPADVNDTDEVEAEDDSGLDDDDDEDDEDQ